MRGLSAKMARALKSPHVQVQASKKDKQIWLPKSKEVQERMCTPEFFQNSIM